MHIQQKHERQQGARRQIGYFKEQVCSAFRGGFLSHLLSQSQEAQNEQYYDHDADDVENVHVYSSGVCAASIRNGALIENALPWNKVPSTSL